jgi:flagellar biosynthesis component FlhA
MRDLLREGISVSNFPAILEVLAEEDDGGAQRVAIRGGRPAEVPWERETACVAAVRRRLARQVAASVVRPPMGNQIPVLVLDERLHGAFTSYDGALPPEDTEIVNDAVRTVLGHWAEPRWPAVLTTSELRPSLRAALAHEFPALAVLAYDELPTDVSFAFAGEISAERD